MTQTLDALLAKLKQEHGDGWIEYTLVRWAQLFDKANLFHTSDDEHEEYGVLSEWVRNMVAAGVAATVQQAAWEPVESLLYEEASSRRMLTVDEDGRLLGISKSDQVMRLIRLPNEYRLCRLVQRPAVPPQWELARNIESVERYENKIEDIIAEFGDDPAQCLTIIGDHISLARHYRVHPNAPRAE